MAKENPKSIWGNTHLLTSYPSNILMPNSKFKSSLVLGLIGSVFSGGVGFLAAALTGAGHGSALPLALIASPEPLGFLIWPTIGIFIPWVKGRPVVIAIIVLLLALNYVTALAVIAKEGSVYLIKTFRLEPALVSVVILTYLGVQIAIVSALVRNRRALKE